MEPNLFKERVLLWPIGGLLILFLLLTVAQKGYDLVQTSKDKSLKNTLSVSGEGKVSATPDLATVNLGVTTQGSTATDVQNENTKKTNKIIDFIKSEGISKDDISTSQFTIYPTYDYRDGKSVINGYQANQTVTVKVRGVDKSTEKLNRILAGVTDAGVNQINGVQLSFDDPDTLRQKARELAINKAKEKAAELAKFSGITLGKVVNVSESSGYYPGPLPYAASEGMGGGAAMDKSIPPNIEPGSQDITATMTVVFEVK